MKHSKSALAALVSTIGLAAPCAAQHAPVPAQSPACVEQIAEYFGCLRYGTLTEAQARMARGHPEFVEAPSPTAPRAGDRAVPAAGVSAVARR